MGSTYYGYSHLKQRYNKSEKSIWRYWAKDGILEPPKRAGKIFLGWTDEQLEKFENGEG